MKYGNLQELSLLWRYALNSELLKYYSQCPANTQSYLGDIAELFDSARVFMTLSADSYALCFRIFCSHCIPAKNEGQLPLIILI